MSTRRNVLKLLAGAAIVGSVAGSIDVLAQVRAAAQTNPPATDRIALKGYDPVAYFTSSTPTPGVAEYNYVHDGVRYFFANARHRDLFKANPDKYAPQFGGFCSYGTAQGYKVSTQPDAFSVVDGKLYLNYNREVVKIWKQDVPGNISKAEENWPEVSKMEPKD